MEIKLEVVENKIDVIAEVQTSHKQQGGRELEVMIEEQRSSSTLLGDSLKNVSADVKEIKTDVSELNEKVEEIRVNLNAVEMITSKNWNEIAHLKAVK